MTDRRAFEEYGVRALWNRRPSAHPTIAQALVIAQGLRNEPQHRNPECYVSLAMGRAAASRLWTISIYCVAVADAALLDADGFAIDWVHRDPGPRA